jgi:hypothetical protein
MGEAVDLIGVAAREGSSVGSESPLRGMGRMRQGVGRGLICAWGRGKRGVGWVEEEADGQLTLLDCLVMLSRKDS